MATHRCPGPACRAQVSAAKLACSPHWKQVPIEIQRRVYATYRKGAGSPEHQEAMDAAIAAMH
jgi:hypothetical protein